MYQGAAANAMTSKSGTESKPGGGQVTDPAALKAVAAAWMLASRMRVIAAATSYSRLVQRNAFINYDDRVGSTRKRPIEM